MPKTKSLSNEELAAEAAFAKKAFEERAELNRKAKQAILVSSGTRQVTIRMTDEMIAKAKHQAEGKGLPYQTYIKMLLHEALTRAACRGDSEG